MTNRERQRAVLLGEPYDRLPIVHFGWWTETLQKWVQEGHLTQDEISGLYDGSEKDVALGKKQGFDYNYFTVYMGSAMSALNPLFSSEVLKEFPDGSRHERNVEGAIVLQKPGADGIPSEVGYTLVDRASWEEHYLPRLKWSPKRVNQERLATIIASEKDRTDPLGLFCGSLFGQIRNWMGVEGISYLPYDDEELFDEIIQTTADIELCTCEEILKSGAKFDFAHFWEDIAFKNGPLVSPGVFYEKVGPQYARFVKLCNQYGIDIISVDCDGAPDTLIPTWLDNGVNTMFPIEVGVWGGSFAPWREKYGDKIRGVGGMDKNVFAQDYAAIDKEIERLKPIIEMGGYIPCPDHRIPPDAIWENVQYYCDKMRKTF